MGKIKIFYLIKYVVSIGLIALILVRADLNGFLSAFKEMKVFYFGIALSIAALNMFIRSYKWQLLLKVHGVSLPFLTVQKINYISMFFNNFFLGSIGGDAFRIYKTIGFSNSRTGTALSVIMERATGLLMSLLCVFVFGGIFILLKNPFIQIDMDMFMVFLAGGVLIMLGILFGIKFFNKQVQYLILKRSPGITKWVEDVNMSFRAYRKHRMAVFIALFLSLLHIFGRILTVYYFVISANADISLTVLSFIVPLVGVVMMIPISVNGIGIQEGSYVFFLEQVGMAGPAALLVAILSRVCLLVFGLIGGILFLIQGHSPKELPRMMEYK